MDKTAFPILLIEDNPVDVDLTIRAFRSQNFAHRIQVCRDGEEALKKITAWDMGEAIPTIILLDLKLPRIDGIEVLRQFKSHSRYKRIPVVILTTSSENNDLQRCYDLGANSYLVKPINYKKFQEVVEQIDLYWLQLNTTPPIG